MRNWVVLSDEQMSKRWQFSLLNDEQMSNWVGVEHLPGKSSTSFLPKQFWESVMTIIIGSSTLGKLMFLKNPGR